MSLNESNAITQIPQAHAGDNPMVLALLDSGYRWKDGTLNFSYQNWPRFNFDDAQGDMAYALQRWGAVANLRFVRSSRADADILFEASTKAKNHGFAGETTFPYQASNFTSDHANGDLGRSHVDLATDSDQVKQSDPGHPGFELFVHEIGHALGIKHPFDQGSTHWAHYFPGLKEGDKYLLGDNGLNQRLYTVMSYNSNSTKKAPDLDYEGYARGPMAFDIAAIQTLYGARTQYNTSDSTYKLMDDQTADQTLLGWTCIWDTKGTDAISYDGTANAVIDLRPATLQNEVGGGGRMSYTWRPDSHGNKVMMTQGYTISGDYTNALKDADGVTGVLIEKARGGSGTDQLTGNDTGNELSGHSNADVLVGNGGNDTLIGGLGLDVMKGGAGDDIYVVDNRFDSISETNSRHQNSGGVDTVQTTVTHYSLPENFRSRIENLTYMGSLSFFGTGNSLNNTIIGGAVADQLTGGEGNDTLDGLAGADTMMGGIGDDTYIVDSLDDVVSENTGEGDAGGVDTIRTRLQFYTLSDDPNSKIENLTLLRPAGGSGIGNALDNTITGTGGADFLQGNDGDDRLIGLGGRDSLIGGVGDDTYVISDSSAIIVEDAGSFGGIDTVETRFTSYTLTGNVENLTFTDLSFRSRSHTGIGNELDNAIRGGSRGDQLSGSEGDDYLYGNGGVDTLQGGAGNDTLRGGAGDDLLNGGSGSDTADYHDMTSKTDINLNLGIARVLKSAGAETDTLVSIENIIGSQSSDKVVGDDNDNSFIYQGWYGSLSSSGGIDTFDGAGGSDTVDFADFRVQMMTIDLTEGTAVGKYSVDSGTGVKNGSKTVVGFSHVENVVASRGDDTIIGDDNDNTFSDAGAFRYQHEAGGIDHYFGGEGNDTADFSRYDGLLDIDLERGDAQASYNVSVQGGGESAAGIAAYLTGIENVTASLDSDTAKGDANDNTFSYAGTFTEDIEAGGLDDYDGREGSNTIDMSSFHGRAIIDLTAGTVSSSYSYQTSEGPGIATQQIAALANIQNAVGGALADTIEGSDDANTISGGGGSDRITSNGGDDRLTGGAGIDTFAFDSTTSGNDVITDFITLTSHRGSHDVLEFSTSVFIDWDHLLAATSDTEDGAYISFDDNNNGITLTGVTKQSLANHHDIDVVFV